MIISDIDTIVPPQTAAGPGIAPPPSSAPHLVERRAPRRRHLVNARRLDSMSTTRRLSSTSPIAASPASSSGSQFDTSPTSSSSSTSTTSSTTATPPPDAATRRHPMVTRARASIHKPNPWYAMTAVTPTVSPIPTSARSALRDPNWKAAMQHEFDALQSNHTWWLIPRLARANIVTGKWVFKHKFNPNGSLGCYKVRWVVRDFTQRAGNWHRLRRNLHLCGEAGNHLHCPNIDRKSSMASPAARCLQRVPPQSPRRKGALPAADRVFDPAQPDVVCLLSRSLYGLRQAPRAWFTRIIGFLISIGFVATRSDSSLSVLRHGSSTAYLLLYVDDMVLSASTDALL